jgi:signal transduction histidine kinase
MDRLIQDLLTYTRLSRREIHMQPVALEKLVREVIEQYPEMQAPLAAVAVVSPLHAVKAHEPSLSQAVSNLLCNAVKFVAPGTKPQVEVRTELRGDQVRLLVRDNGIGVPPAHTDRLFGMFERVHPDKKYEGTGIGLAIVRKAAERMNGSAGVDSDGANGSTFWIQLPVASDS